MKPRRAKPVLKSLGCKRCGQVDKHTLDCFITEFTTAVLVEFGAGEFSMHLPCASRKVPAGIMTSSDRPLP